jgi:hypothetical protein
MKYQLVLQFDAISIKDFDRLVAIEEKLISQLVGIATVDGHGFGSGEFDIFILTDDPDKVFEMIKGILDRQEQLPAYRAAYRAKKGEDYVIVWPPTLTRFRII